MGRIYDAALRAERQRKRFSPTQVSEDVPGKQEPLRSEPGLSGWRRWVSNGDAPPPSEASHTALIEQIASLEVTVGALDDQLARKLPEIERRWRGEASEDLKKLEDRLSSLTSTAADALSQRFDRLSGRISLQLWLILAALLTVLFRI